MERNYKAFISYRHLPIDAETAQKIHRTIEHYVVPKAFRKNGEKKLGLVFRDKDELPITSNLSDNLRMALDHSEYLIVICSPKTKESVWVLEEIEYFMAHHDRDHVLVFLVDGTMEESVPLQLTEEYDHDGQLIRHVEPLAANIVADSKRKRNQLYKVEILRILATLIGCPFDALYRREMRYKAQRVSIASVAILVVVMAFAGMMWNKNQQINAQLKATQINDSRMKALLSENAAEDGAYLNGLNYALEALPQEEDSSDRPYVPEAEFALASRVSPYLSDWIVMSGSLEISSNINKICLSDDGRFMLITDASQYTVQAYEVANRNLLWENTTDNTIREIAVNNDTAIAMYSNATIAFAMETGEKKWEVNDGCNYMTEKHKKFLCGIKDGKIVIYSLVDGSMLAEIPYENLNEYSEVKSPVLSEDGRYLAFAARVSAADGFFDLCVWDMQEKNLQIVKKIEEGGFWLNNMTFAEGNRLMVAEDHISNELPLTFYTLSDGAFTEEKSVVLNKEFDSPYYKGLLYVSPIEFMEEKDGMLCIISRRSMFFADYKEAKSSKFIRLPEIVANAVMLEDGSVLVATLDGSISQATTKGLTSEKNYNYSKSDFAFKKVSMSGSSMEDMTIAVVSDDNERQCTFFTWKEDSKEAECLIPFENDKNALLSIPSLDGKSIGFYYIDKNDGSEEGNTLYLTMVDQNLKKKEYSFSISETTLSNDAYLIPTEKIVNYGKYYSLNTGENDYLGNAAIVREGNPQELIIGEVESVQGKNEAGELILEDVILHIETLDDDKTVSLAEQMKTLYPEIGFDTSNDEINWSSCRVLQLDQNGHVLLLGTVKDQDFNFSSLYLVYDVETDSLTELEDIMDESGDTEVTFSNHGFSLVYKNRKGQMVLKDLHSDKEEVIFENLYDNNLSHVEFDQEDRYLFAFTPAGEFKVFDVGDGSLLYQKSFSDRNLSFSNYGGYQSFYSEKQDRMIFIYDNHAYTKSVGLVYDFASMALVGFYMGMTYYFPETDKVLVNNYKGDVMVHPFYSCEDLKRMGKVMLGDGDITSVINQYKK